MIEGPQASFVGGRSARPARRWLLILAVATFATGGHCEGRPGYDRYGGWTGVQSEATGRFRVEEIDGVWWFITPDGNGFFSAGVNHVSHRADASQVDGRRVYMENVLAKHGTPEAWSDAVVERFADLGLNTIGAWSEWQRFDGRVPFTVILGFVDGAPVVPDLPAGVTGQRVRDYFDPLFMATAAAHAEIARGCANSSWCLGVFTDNELGWGVGFAQAVPYLDGYLSLPASAAGKAALQGFVEARYAGEIEALNAAWGTQLADFDEIQTATPATLVESAPLEADRRAFRAHVAGHYARVIHDLLRAVDPEMLILGSRFLCYNTAPEVSIAMAPYVDVLSTNYYPYTEFFSMVTANTARASGFFELGRPFEDLDEMHRTAGKPILITEFSFRAADAGLPNSWPGIYPTVPDQQERADRYEAYLTGVLARPYLTGAHWFEHADQPEDGRFDGEDNNFGIVSLRDDVYVLLGERMRSIGERWRARSRRTGGGDARWDCALEWLVSGPTAGRSATEQACVDGDPSCDLEADAGVCELRVTPCAPRRREPSHAARACRLPSAASTIEILSPDPGTHPELYESLASELSAIEASSPAPTCSLPVPVRVPVGETRRIGTRAFARRQAGGARWDEDELLFRCKEP